MENISALSRTAPASSRPYYVCTRSVPKNDGTNDSQTTFELRDGNNSLVDVGDAPIPVSILNIPQKTSPTDLFPMWAIINSQGVISISMRASAKDRQSRERDKERDIYRFLWLIGNTMAESLQLPSHFDNDDDSGGVDVVTIAGLQGEEANTINLGKKFVDTYLGTSAPYPDKTHLCNYFVNFGPMTQLRLIVNVPSYILRRPGEPSARAFEPTGIRVVNIPAQKTILNAASGSNATRNSSVLNTVARYKIIYKYLY